MGMRYEKTHEKRPMTVADADRKSFSSVSRGEKEGQRGPRAKKGEGSQSNSHGSSPLPEKEAPSKRDLIVLFGATEKNQKERHGPRGEGT